MAILTINIPDNKTEQISKIVENIGGSVISKITDGLTIDEKKSLAVSIEEAKLIKEGKLKALNFNDLWD